MREDFVQLVKARFLLRLHMLALIVVVYMFGVLVDWLLYRLGLHTMPMRYGVAMVFAYVASFGFLRLWLLYIMDSPEINGHTFRMSAKQKRNADKARSLRSRLDGADLDIEPTTLDPGGGWSIDVDDLAIALLLAAAVSLFIGGYLIYEAPVILAEAAFQAAIAGAIMQPSREMHRRVAEQDPTLRHWALAFLRSTVIPVGIVWITVVCAAAFAVQQCPGSTKASDIQTCLASRGP